MHCRIRCSAPVVMSVVVWSWDVRCVHCKSYFSKCNAEANSKAKWYLLLGCQEHLSMDSDRSNPNQFAFGVRQNRQTLMLRHLL